MRRIDRANDISAKTARLAKKAYRKARRAEDQFDVSGKVTRISSKIITEVKKINETERIAERTGILLSTLLDRINSVF